MYGEPAPASPGTARVQCIAALQAAARQCDGDCGLDEQTCYDTHPITWCGTVRSEVHIEGPVSAIVDVTLAAQDMAAPTGRHVYLSTGCLHGEHGYCASATGTNGHTRWAKQPAKCKFCGTGCTCPCHEEIHGERHA